MPARQRRLFERFRGIPGKALRAAQGSLARVWLDRTMLIYAASPAGIHASAGSDEVVIECMPVGDSRATALVNEASRARLESSLLNGPDTQVVYRALTNGALAAWGIAYFGSADWPITETRTSLRIADGEGALTSFFVEPVFRGRRLYQRLLARMASDAEADGVRRLWIWCDATNIASKRAIERVGFSRLARHTLSVRLGRSRPPDVESVTG